MSKYGLQFSQEGVPIGRSGDFQKVLDDRWPYLDIAAEQTDSMVKTSFPSGDGYWLQEILTHNLGYIPAISFREHLFYANPAGGSADYDIVRPKIVATKDKVYMRALRVPSGIFNYTEMAWQYTIRVFAVDITTDKNYDIEQPGASPRSKSGKYGVKVISPKKVGPSLNSEEMSDFSLNSDAKALAIQSHGTRVTSAANSFSIIVNHGLTYPPTYLIATVNRAADWASAYTNPLPEDCIQPMNYELLGISSNVGTTLTIAGAQGALIGTFAFLILKDPLGAAA